MTVILRHYFFKTQRGQRISPSEIDPNPILSRTDADLSRDVENEMNSPWAQPIGLPGIGSVCSHGFTFARLNSEKLETRDSAPRPTCSRSARSGAVFAGMGVGRSGLKPAERWAIWRPGVASRAAVGPGSRVRRGSRLGCRGGRGGRFSGF